MSKTRKDFKKKRVERGIDALINWTHKKGYDIEFDYCVHDEFRPDDKMITISTRQGREKQLYSLLHECGHLILQNNDDLYSAKYPSSAKMANYNSNRTLKRSEKYKVDVMAEEIDAWRKGKDLAKRLGVYVDEDNYYSTSTKCLYTYIKSLAR